MDFNWIFQNLAALLTQFKQSIFELIPNIVAALVILFLGFVFARLMRGFISRLVNNCYRIIPYQKVRDRLKRLLVEKPVANVISTSVYWILIFFFLTAATEALGLAIVTTWLSGLTGYLPKILTAVLIGFIGFIAGVILKDIVTAASRSMGILYADTLGKLTQAAILIVSTLIAIDLIGIDVTLLTSFVVILLAAFLFGAALAFALGSRTSVSNILAAYYLQKIYNVGQTVKIGDVKGQIAQITPTALILDTPEGQAMVPAKAFSETISTLTIKEP
jgi:hypothetical protein